MDRNIGIIDIIIGIEIIVIGFGFRIKEIIIFREGINIGIFSFAINKIGREV